MRIPNGHKGLGYGIFGGTRMRCGDYLRTQRTFVETIAVMLAVVVVFALPACAAPGRGGVSTVAPAPTSATAQRLAELSVDEDQPPLDEEDLAPYVPTPQEVVEEMLKLAQVKKDDVVYDLGCGDGRIVITAAKKYGARGVGVDFNPVRVREARANAREQGVETRVTILRGDALKTPLTSATVVTLYLLPDSNAKLRPRLEQLLPVGARVVSHDFNMPVWKAVETKSFKDKNGVTRKLFLWKITPEMKKKQ